jgi:nucleoside triphosphatase
VTEQQYPEPTVGALIFNPSGELFLMKSHKWRGKYVVPGGHIELGETMEEALRREVLEETGLHIYEIEFLLFQEFIYDESFWKRSHFIFFDYACKTDETEVRLNDEAEEYVWVPVEEALKLPLDAYMERAILAYVQEYGGQEGDGGLACPSCGSTRCAEILYGRVSETEKLRDQICAGKVVLGGCLESDGMPEWRCLECGREWRAR